MCQKKSASPAALYPPNLPSEVQEKVDQLDDYQKQISILEQRLLKIRADRDRLRDELAQYRIYAAPAPPQEVALEEDRSSLLTISVTIESLPNEMLLQIFEIFLSYNHQRIRSLLLVYRRWHSLVMESPTLWARIELSPVDYSDYTLSTISSALYVNACLQRSHSLLLDVELGYEEFRGREGYIRDEVEIAACAIADDSEDNDIANWALDLECDFASSEYDRYYDNTLNDLDILIGPSGENMARWTALELRVPWQEPLVACDLWFKFVGDTPNLKHTNLTHFQELFEMLEDINHINSSFPTLSGLRSLTIDTAQILKHIAVSSASLQHLDLYFLSLSDISDLTSFPLLQKLSLRTLTSVKPNSRAHQLAPRPPVCFPELQELRLRGDCHLLRHIPLDFPNVQVLRVESGNSFYIPVGLSPAHIHWTVLNPRDDHWTAENIILALSGLLRLSNSVEKLTVPESMWSAIPGALSELSQTKSLPESLERITVELGVGETNIINLT